jgi:hypothetical protein
MKNQILFIMILLSFNYAGNVKAQNIAINNNGEAPNASAMLDVSASDKGVLIPRLTQAQRDVITDPATGLIIYQTDNTPGLYYNSGTPTTPAWATVGSNAAQWLTNGTSLYYNAGNVGIGTSTPTAKLQVSGGDALINGLTVGKGASSVATNSAFGYQALQANTTGHHNTANGYQALYTNTSRSYLVAVGDSALYKNGTSASQTYHATCNTAVGSKALYANTTGYYNSALGFKALYSNTTGPFNSAFGYQALTANTTGSFNTAIGFSSMYKNVSGSSNTSFGYRALAENTAGGNTAIGAGSLDNNTTGNNNTAIGYYTSYSNQAGKYNTAIGSSALGENLTGHSNVAIGVMALISGEDRSNLVAIGDSALMNNGIGATEPGHSVKNVAVGSKALYNNTIGHNNTATGFQALYSNTSGYQNVALGSQALYTNSTGSFNTAVGNYSLNANTTGSRNAAFGYMALLSNTGGGYNTASGIYSLSANTTGEKNTATGSQSLYLNSTGNENTALGYRSLYYGTQGYRNVALGSYSGYYETDSNRLYIDNQSRGNLENGRQKSMIYGVFDADPAKQKLTFNSTVGIGTTNPDITAVLDMTSTTKGVLIPRLTTTERNAIAAPAEGLMVFCTDCGVEGSLSIFSNGTWKTFSPCSSITPAAGINDLTPGQIIWRWKAVTGAAGYRWNNLDDYSSSLEMGTTLSKTQTGIDCDSVYSGYVWSYNSCSNSAPLIMTVDVPSTSPVAPTAGAHVGGDDHISWKWNEVSGAVGYKWNNTNDYASALDVGTLTAHYQGGLTCGTSCTSYAWAYNSCGYSSPVTLTKSTDVCCGGSLIINHVAGDVAPVTKTVTYGTVEGIPGETSKCWITSNLGAGHQATAKDDATEASAGWYWQFNRMQGYKHDGTTRIPGTWIDYINENGGWNYYQDPCRIELEGDWRIPTYDEWYNVDDQGGWTDWNGPWNSSLKMHAAGYLDSNGDLLSRGTEGKYWSETQIELSGFYLGRFLSFYSTSCFMYYYDKEYGMSVRCVRE